MKNATTPIGWYEGVGIEEDVNFFLVYINLQYYYSSCFMFYVLQHIIEYRIAFYHKKKQGFTYSRKIDCRNNMTKVIFMK